MHDAKDREIHRCIRPAIEIGDSIQRSRALALRSLRYLSRLFSTIFLREIRLYRILTEFSLALDLAQVAKVTTGIRLTLCRRENGNSSCEDSGMHKKCISTWRASITTCTLYTSTAEIWRDTRERTREIEDMSKKDIKLLQIAGSSHL